MYEQPNRIPYYFGNFDFGAGSETFSIRGPKGKTGRLWDYGVVGVIEVITGSSGAASVAVGTSDDADAYGEELNLNATADNEARSVRMLYDEASDKAAFDALMVAPEIPKDTEVVLSCTGASGTPTGQAVPFVIIDWSW